MKKKIPIPQKFWSDTQEVVHKKTQLYWKLSQGWNGNPSIALTTSSAFSIVNQIEQDIDPNRLVVQKAKQLKDFIVVHGTKNKLQRFQASNIQQDQNIMVPKIYVL